MASDKKSNIAIVCSIITAGAVVVGAILKLGGEQATNNITYEKQQEMEKNISAIKETTDWTKTTLINHIESERDLKQTIIEQNKVLIESLKK